MATAFRTCPLCEARCGLEITVADGVVERIRGDADDVFSHGFICPKGTSLKALHEDPDRLRTPLVRGADGEHREATWDEAFAEIDRRLPPLIAEHGPQQPSRSTSATRRRTALGPLLYGRVLLKALGHAQHLLGEHGRPVPQAARVRAHVRHRAHRRRCPTSTAPTTC